MRSSARKFEIEKLDHALEILDEAAQRSGREIREMIESDYDHLKKTLQDVTPQVTSAVSSMGRSAQHALKQQSDRARVYARKTAEDIDTQAHDNPWTFIGAAAIAGGLVGYFLSRRG